MGKISEKFAGAIPISMDENVTATRLDFHCPSCKTVRPPYSFEMNGADLGVIGQVQYLTIFCGAELPDNPVEVNPQKRTCGAILTVAVIGYRPPMDPRQLAELEAALKNAQKPRA